MTRNLGNFSNPEKKSVIFLLRIVSWLFVSRLMFERSLCPSSFKIALLRIWGARIGTNVLLKRNIRISFPWLLEVGQNSWIGEGVWLINHAKIAIGSNVCISQRSIICSGSHDYRSASLEYAHKPIVIKDGTWVCLDAKVLPGVTLGECSVVSAGEIVRESLPNYSILVGGQVRRINPPK